MSEQGLFSIGEVASMVGLSRHTIRAWERRHRLVQPERTPSGQRRYTADDVALLVRVKHAAVRRGVSLKVAVRCAQGKLSLPAVEDQLPATAGAVIGMIVMLDIDGSISAANRAASQALGVAPHEMVGRRITDLLEETGGRTRLETALQRAYVQPSSFELELRSAPGVTRWAFECRPFSYEGRPRLAMFGRPAVRRRPVG
jgi:PAS domain S-box-containing protein